MRRLVLIAFAACGSNSATPIDAAIITPTPDSTIFDAMIDAAPTPAGCDFGEQNDLGNDDVNNMGTPEATGLTFTTATTICGNIDIGHYASNTEVVDTDSYMFTVAATGDLLVSLTGLAAFEASEVVLLDAHGNFIQSGAFFGDHGILSAHVTAGSYELTVDAEAAAALAAVVPYKVKIATDNATARCPQLTTATNYTEALDTTANDQAGNDVLTISYAATGTNGSSDGTNVALTAATTDGPEPTGLTIAPGQNVRITGTAKLPTAASPDDYLERDTYLITTGTTTNQLAIRLDWPGQSDFDYYVLPENSTDLVAGSAVAMAGEDEFATFAVLPNQRYWLWIAPFNTDAASTTLLPVTYDASICGAQFTP